MGFDMDYQAIPDGCALLEQLRNDPIGGEYVWGYIFHEPQKGIDRAKYFEAKGLTRIPQEGIAFLEEAKRTLENNPDIETRCVAISRAWDMLCFLLSEARRNEGDPRTDLGGQAIVGGEELAAKSGQGFPVYYLNPDEVHQVVAMFNTIDYERLKKNFDPIMMSNAAVYKVSQFVSDEHCFNTMWSYFEQVRKFYTVVADHNEGVLAFLW